MGALENTGKEIIALVPVLLVLMRRLGCPELTAVAASLGMAFSPTNPQAGVAQLPLLLAGGYRRGFLALVVWIGGTVRHATRHRTAPDSAASATAGAGGMAWCCWLSPCLSTAW